MKNYIQINAMIPIDDTEYHSKSIKIRNLLEELSIDNTSKIDIKPYHKYTSTPDGRYHIGDIFAEKHNNRTKFYLITGIDKIKTDKDNSFIEIPTDFYYLLYCLECVTLEQIKKNNDHLIDRMGDGCKLYSSNDSRFIKLDNFDLYVNTNRIRNHRYSPDLIHGHFYPGWGNATEDGYIFRNLGNCGEEILNKVIKIDMKG